MAIWRLGQIGGTVGSFGSKGDTAVMDMMTKPWKANVVLSVTVKDEAGNPMNARAEVNYFIPTGTEGGFAIDRMTIEGSRRIELTEISDLILSLDAEDYNNFESIEKKWNFNDLDPSEWEVGRDGSTVMIRYDAVLKSFPASERARLETINIDLAEWSTVEYGLHEEKSVLRVRTSHTPLSDIECETPTLLSGFVAASQPVPEIPGRKSFYPDGVQVALRVCSPNEEDGLLDSGTFATDGRFGNTTPEAPTSGYQKELVLPYQWFEQPGSRIVFIRLGGLYGKLRFGTELGFPRDRPILLSERPLLGGELIYNPTGSRNLRTTYPD
jgi:hypothetical protein